MKANRLTELALLTALASIIFIVELHLPNLSPVPGVKLGLANIITVYAVYRFKAYETALIVAARVLIGSMFSGNFSAVIYSFSGAVVCLIGMIFIRKIIPVKYIWLCSIIGGILHNIGQITAAVIVMKTTAVISYLPILICSGCIAGAFTGVCAGLVLSRKPSEKIN